jgi:tetratricopeptide (TPR) repeat protein
MVVLGTRSEHFNAVWVRNEWSRYLALIKNGASKMLIPAYRDMDPYDLPGEFSHLQAQDMAKLGFMQDLTHGIKKIIGTNPTPKSPTEDPTAATTTAPNIPPLLKRAFMFLEDGEFDRADDFSEQILNQDPENAQAYLVKLMAELHVKKPEELKDCKNPFDGRNHYKRAVLFGDDQLKATLAEYVEHIKTRNENERCEKIYNQAIYMMKHAATESEYRAAIDVFNRIRKYKDADAQIGACLLKIDLLRAKPAINYQLQKPQVEIEKIPEIPSKKNLITRITLIILGGIIGLWVAFWLIYFLTDLGFYI